MKKKEILRADELVVRQGLASSRSQAKVLILAGEVRTADQRVTKPSERLAASTQLRLRNKPKFVSRGGSKLEAALDSFSIDVAGFVAADIGASTGGFTDCLLQRGAARVYAIDVGYGQLAFTLRNDERVIVMERVNARSMPQIVEPIDLITIDVSFISLRLVLENVKVSLKPGGRCIALIKPQFEAGRQAVNRRGVVKDDAIRKSVVCDIIEFAANIGFGLSGLVRSPLVGPAGNHEFIVSFVDGKQVNQSLAHQLIDDVFDY